MSTRDIIRAIGHFLFSRANREFLIFLFFFATAGIFWLLTSLNETYEEEVKLVVHYINIPKNAVLTSAEDDTLRVNVSDKGINLATFIYKKTPKAINVDFQHYAHSAGTGSVPAGDLAKLVAKAFPASARVTAIKPEKLTFYYNNGERKRVPVRMRGQVVPEKLYFIADTICTPDSVTIFASKAKLDSISVIYTQAINYAEFHDTLTLTASTQKIDGVKVMPHEVQLQFITDVLTEESIGDIPVVGINMPEGKVLRTFPSKVSVSFVTGMKNIQNLSASDFRVEADYEEFSRQSSPKCNIYLRRSPEGISRVKLNVQQVDYLVEERQP